METINKFLSIIDFGQKKKLIQLLFLMVLGAVFETLSISLIVPLVSFLTVENSELSETISAFLPWTASLNRDELIFYAMLIFVFIYLIKTFYMILLASFQARYYFSIQSDISSRLFFNYLNQPYSFHLQKNSGNLISYIITESMQFAQGFLAPLLIFITETLIVLCIFILLILVEPIGALTVAIFLGISSLILYLYSKNRSSQWGEKRQRNEALRLQYAQQGLSGIKDVKIYGKESFFHNIFKNQTTSTLKFARKQTVLQNIPRYFLEFLAIVGLTFLIFILMNSVSDTQELIAVLGLFAMATFKILPSASRIVSSLQAFRFSIPVVEIVSKELISNVDLVKRKNQKEISPLKESLVLKNINFSYEGSDKETLAKIDMNILSGSTVGFIGPSGAGKSTLVDITLGLLSPNTGEVLIDKKTLDSTNKSFWQDQIGYVPQVIYLLDDSLKRNIAFGIDDEDIDNNKINEAIKLSQLEELIKELPEGIETLVGEQGVRLSGGQRQRVGIARALYNDPSVLVLDEATSSLDVNTELEVMKSVRDLKGKKTILIIAHRFSTVEHCNYLYRLEDGKVIEEGIPSEILYK